MEFRSPPAGHTIRFYIYSHGMCASGHEIILLVGWLAGISIHFNYAILPKPFSHMHGSIKAVTMFDSIEFGWIFKCFSGDPHISLFFFTPVFVVVSVWYWVTVMYTQRNQANKTKQRALTQSEKVRERKMVCACVGLFYRFIYAHKLCCALHSKYVVSMHTCEYVCTAWFNHWRESPHAKYTC